MNLTVQELGGFAVIVAAFLAAMALFDVEPQSWTSFGLLAFFLAVLVSYRWWLRSGRSAR